MYLPVFLGRKSRGGVVSGESKGAAVACRVRMMARSRWVSFMG